MDVLAIKYKQRLEAIKEGNKRHIKKLMAEIFDKKESKW